MKSSAGLSGHLATDRSRICETGIVSRPASQRTPGGYDLIQGAAGMTYSYLRERTACARLRPLVSERKEKLTRLVPLGTSLQSPNHASAASANGRLWSLANMDV